LSAHLPAPIFVEGVWRSGKSGSQIFMGSILLFQPRMNTLDRWRGRQILAALMAEVKINVKPNCCPICGATIKWDKETGAGTCKCSDSPEKKWKATELKGEAAPWWLLPGV